MAEQGSDSAKTEASGAEFVRQRLDQNTRLAHARKPGLLAPAALSRSQSWSEGSAPRCLWCQDRWLYVRGTCGAYAQ